MHVHNTNDVVVASIMIAKKINNNTMISRAINKKENNSTYIFMLEIIMK